MQIKQSILDLGRSGTVGAKIAAVKVVQRIIQTQTRGTADPRVSHISTQLSMR